MLRATIVLLVLTLSRSWAAEVTTLQDPNSGLYSWKVVDRGFSLELVQLPPDFIRAVYASRDLPPPMIEEVAGYCAFGSIARNETNSPLSYRVADWRAVTPDGTRHRLRTKTEWLNHWKKMGVDFSFSILPDAMTFDVGDWAQGFTTVKLARGAHFDLIYTWRQHGKTFTGKLPKLFCTSDTPKQP
jgi:hypothetical protein